MTDPSDSVSFLDAPDDPYRFYEWAERRNWTDGLPLIPPTRDRMDAMLAAVQEDPDQMVARLDPRRGVASVWKIATNAVMAGCRPKYLPVILAAVRAMARPRFNLNGIQCTTNPVAPLAVINGPVRGDLHLNHGRNVLGQGHRANATIGRALRLLLMNIGGGMPGETDKSTHGMPGKYTFCIAEAEEASPWDPLHVEQGFEPEQNVVSMVGAQSTNSVFPVAQPETTLQIIGQSMAVFGANNVLFGRGNPVVLLPPGHAERLHRSGFSKEDVKDRLFEESSLSEEQLPPEENLELPRDLMDWHWVDGRIRICQNAGDILVIVCGGPEPYHVTTMTNFGDTLATHEPIH